MLSAIGPEDGENIDGKNQAPEKQRAFLVGPQCGKFEECGLAAAAGFDDIGDRKIICEVEIFEAGNGDDDQSADGHSSVACAFDEKRIAGADCEDAADYRIRRADECEKEGE